MLVLLPAIDNTHKPLNPSLTLFFSETQNSIIFCLLNFKFDCNQDKQLKLFYEYLNESLDGI